MGRLAEHAQLGRGRRRGEAQHYTQLFAATDLVLCEGPFMAQSLIALG